MSVDATGIRTKVIEEINLLPVERLIDLYNLIHYFRIGIEQSHTIEQPQVAKVMALAGSWSDMPADDFTDFLEEIEERRQSAFQTRRNDAAHAD